MDDLERTPEYAVANKRVAKIDSIFKILSTFVRQRQGEGKYPVSAQDTGNFTFIANSREIIVRAYALALILFKNTHQESHVGYCREVALLELIIMRIQPFQFDIMKDKLNREINSELAIFFSIFNLADDLGFAPRTINDSIDHLNRNDHRQYLTALKTPDSDESVSAIATMLRTIGRNVLATKKPP